jgi:hypothetical protein
MRNMLISFIYLCMQSIPIEPDKINLNIFIIKINNIKNFYFVFI